MIIENIEPRALSLLGFSRIQQEHANLLAKATGEHFNIFQILRIGHLEVGTHSPILAELLNPVGKHGQGPSFLRLFVFRFGIADFDAVTAKVDIEYHAGTVTESSGGRIDILIRDSNGATILIENKIYAGDQKNQLVRYQEFAKNAHLIYLTLDGRDPSTGTKVPGLRCLSYASDILAWLKDCRKEAACVPTVRETISQYIHLLQELTHQNTDIHMSKELTKAVLQDPESYRAYIAIRNTETDVKSAIIAGFNDKLRLLGEELDLELCQELGANSGRYEGWFYTSPILASHNVTIGFECDRTYYRDFYLGFKRNSAAEPSPILPFLAKAYNEIFGENHPTTLWPANTWWHRHRHWNDNTFEAIQFGNFIGDVRNDLKRMLAVLDRAQDLSKQQLLTAPTL